MADKLTIIDGGVGSELRRRGIALSDVAWSAIANVDAGSHLTEIHTDFIRAGADVVTANTFGNARFVLDAAGLSERFRALNVTAIDAALRARDLSRTDVTIAASLSCFPPAFDRMAYPDPATELDAYRELIAIFEELGIELVLLEMMQDTQHATLACKAATESKLPFWLGVSCRAHPGQPHLSAFDAPSPTFAEILDALIPFEPDAVNIMHSPVDAILPAMRELGTRWTGRVGAYAEIPYPEDPEQSNVDRMSSSAYAEHALQWIEHGATIIGGCCGTTPEHIAALKALRDR